MRFDVGLMRLGSSLVNVNKMKGSSKIYRRTSSLLPGADAAYSSMMWAGSNYSNRGFSAQADYWYTKAAYYRNIVTRFYCGNATAMRDDINGRPEFPAYVHYELDVAGLAPYVGIPANLVHYSFYMGERKLPEAALSLAGAFLSIKSITFGLSVFEGLVNAGISSEALIPDIRSLMNERNDPGEI